MDDIRTDNVTVEHGAQSAYRTGRPVASRQDGAV
jgi:hypothetical protein